MTTSKMDATFLSHSEKKIDTGVFRNPNMGPAVKPSEYLEKPLPSDWLVGERPDTWYTGLHPLQCPGMGSDGVLRILGHPDLSRCTKKELIDYFDNSWTLTDVLFASLVGEEAFIRPPYHGLRHPMIFYYGHPAVVGVNKLRVAGILKDPVDPYLESILETGVDEMSWDDMSKNEMQWPSVASVMEYKRTVYKLIRGVIENLSLPISIDDPAFALLMHVEHEHIHLETSSCLLRELPLQFLQVPKYWPLPHPAADSPAPQNEMIPVAAGTVELGKNREFPSFGWDNEYGTRTVHVPSFKASKFKITNGEYLEFVKDGGYRDESLWTIEGWGWRRFRNAKWPTWWVPDGPAGLHQYKLRTIFHLVSLPLSWPVCVNCHEAKAYANWMTRKTKAAVPYRIMTEAEHNRLRDKQGAQNIKVEDDPGMLIDGNQIADKFNFNLSLAFGSESPVDGLKPNQKGFHDVMGNVWEWCEDDFNPLDGFKVSYLYDDFSVPCFDGKHNIIMGGSFISGGELASVFARYHFRPHFFQHCGFRVVLPDDAKGLDRIRGSVIAYSAATARLAADALAQYCDMATVFPAISSSSPIYSALSASLHLPSRTLDLATPLLSSSPNSSLLVVECGPGGACVSAPPSYTKIVGVSCETAAIDMAKNLVSNGKVQVQRVDEGNLSQPVTIQAEVENKSRLEFFHADALTMGLDAMSDADKFGVVLVGEIERLHAPKTILSSLSHVTVQNSLALISFSGNWSSSPAPSSHWVGGGKDRQGKGTTTREGVLAALGADWQLVEEHDLPSVVPCSVTMGHFANMHVIVARRV